MRKDGPPIRFVAIGLVLSAGMLLGQYELLVRPDNTVELADAEYPVMTIQVASLERSSPSEAAMTIPALKAEPAVLEVGTSRQ
ncbi:hypothetical protein [Methylobacterium longum]|uniref:SAF domain-containing protein n=1 Tax=Methylobacterium longum TaxID=767694 RepID=A0ABT8AZ25_9HYPH|nr:hypothetical protein [Methylobacterium longum]MDN3575010.1 hypothetical protein [Methylobacterium longum]